MVCPHCKGAEKVFSESWARDDLKTYRKKGASKTTQLVIDVLTKAGINDLSLLDIGGGVGAIQHGLMAHGASHAVDVDASAAYITVAQEESERRGYIDKTTYVHGDFVQIADTIDAADIVTLDRVICCYPDMNALVKLSAERAKKYYALVYPRDNIFTRYGIRIFNFFAFRLSNSPFRTYIHSSKRVDTIVRDAGFTQLFHKYVGLWQVFVYQR